MSIQALTPPDVGSRHRKHGFEFRVDEIVDGYVLLTRWRIGDQDPTWWGSVSLKVWRRSFPEGAAADEK